MDYVIKNSKQVYIRLNPNGQPITCGERSKELFEFSKAKNIHSNLPKTLRRMNFRVEPQPEGITKHKEVIESNIYKVSDEVIKWKDKFKTCGEIIEEAKCRLDELTSLLHDNNARMEDIVHKIELEDNKNMYEGYLLYVEMRNLRRNRRLLKDEKLILRDVVNMNFSNFSSDIIEKTIAGLSKRKYEMRIVDEDE